MSSDIAPLDGAASRLQVWLHSLRAPFLTVSGIPVFLGALAAFHRTGSLSAGRLTLTLGGVLCVHLGANLANDFYDEITGCDRLNPCPTPFSGGSRVIQQGLLPARVVLASSICFFALGLIQGLWLNRILPGNQVLAIGIVGALCGFLYTAVPFKLSYRGMGEVLVFLAFGPLVVAGSYLCQVGSIPPIAVLISGPAGLLVAAILLVNEVLDCDADRRAGKRTLVVMLGGRRGYALYLSVFAGAYAWLAVGLAVGWYRPLAAIAFLPLVAFMRQLLPVRALSDRESTVSASRLTIMSHTITVSILAASFLF
ncbi:MAG: prenyltransferase [Candidatus Eisenbacteria bacterium]